MEEEITPEKLIAMGKRTQHILLSGLSPKERLKGLKPEERMAGLKPEERMAGLSVEEIEAYLKKLEKSSPKN
ncbi:MAG: hypothetical protein GY795_51110 [Desulfobacterales bacterium]|nr:hypothetical protein [Desulfobacterales bacterium]